VPAGADILMLLGLPAIFVTAYIQRSGRRLDGSKPSHPGTLASMAMRAQPHVTWKRTVRAGGIALGAFVLLVAAFMALRAMGIGPAGSLFAKGVLTRQDALVVTDFAAPAADSSLGDVVSEAVRSDLAQSHEVTVVRSSEIAEALANMQRPATTRIDLPLARELAQRSGYKAVIDGTITPVNGGGYILTLRLMNAASGDELASVREEARDAGDLIPAIDRVTRDLRGRLGESLRDVQSAPSLARVTTASLPALRKYTEGYRANYVESDFPKAIALLDEATKLDTNFAEAYRLEARVAQNANKPQEMKEALIAKAFAHRESLPDGQRALVEADYYANYYQPGPHTDRQKAIAAYLRAIADDPGNGTTENLLGLLYEGERQYARAESVYTAAVAHTPSGFSMFNLAMAQLNQGKLDAAARTVAAAERRFPDFADATATVLPAEVWIAQHGIDSMAVLCDRGTLPALAGASQPRVCAVPEYAAGQIARALSSSARTPDPSFMQIWANASLLDRPAVARKLADSLAALHPPARVSAGDVFRRNSVVRAYAAAGEPEKARAYYQAMYTAMDTAMRRSVSAALHVDRARIAMAERQYPTAVKEFTAADTEYDGRPVACGACRLPELGFAYDLAGDHAAAVRTFEQYVSSPGSQRIGTDPYYLAAVYKRLGELYDEQGKPDKAADYFSRFVHLWRNADPELQPKVAEVRARLAILDKAARR